MNTLRISDPALIEKTGEDTDKLVLDLARQLGVPFEPWEISRSHRVGAPHLAKPRPIIVSFIGYEPTMRLYSARRVIRERVGEFVGVFINEDLTKLTSELAYKARDFKRRKLVFKIYTLIIKGQGEMPILIKDFNHLGSVAQTRLY